MAAEIDERDLDFAARSPYNGTGSSGANPLEFNVNVWYQVNHRSQQFLEARDQGRSSLLAAALQCHDN